jgi:hypothetical protein
MVHDKVVFQFLQRAGYRGIVARLRYRITIAPKSKGLFFLVELNNEIENLS